MNLLVLLFYRASPLEIETKTVKDDDDVESIEKLEVNIPALYYMSPVP
jgi:hypothetical protein